MSRPITASGITGYGTEPRVRLKALRPEVAEPECDPESVREAGSDGVKGRPDDGVQDRKAPRDDREADEEHRRVEDRRGRVGPLARTVERQWVEKHPGGREPHEEVVRRTPATPSTISHQVTRANTSPAARTGKPTETSTQNEKPMTANPAQPRNAPSPCAVIIAYQVLRPPGRRRPGSIAAGHRADRMRGGSRSRRSGSAPAAAVSRAADGDRRVGADHGLTTRSS